MFRQNIFGNHNNNSNYNNGSHNYSISGGENNKTIKRPND